MRHDEQVQAVIPGLRLELTVCANSSSWVNLCGELGILFQLEAVGDPCESLVLHVAFLEDERRILLHLQASLLSPAVSVSLDLDLFCRHYFLTLELLVQLDCLTSLLRHHIVQLTCVVLAGEGEVLSEDDLPEDVLTVALFGAFLLLAGKLAVDALGLLRNNFVQH